MKWEDLTPDEQVAFNLLTGKMRRDSCNLLQAQIWLQSKQAHDNDKAANYIKQQVEGGKL